MADLTTANVVWWSSSQICVRCSYCDSHEFIVVNKSKIVSSNDFYIFYQKEMKTSTCGKGRHLCIFPFNASHTAYEIDASKARFISVLEEQPAEKQTTETALEQLDNLFANASLADNRKPSDPGLYGSLLGFDYYKNFRLRGLGTNPYQLYSETIGIHWLLQGQLDFFQKHWKSVDVANRQQFAKLSDERGDTLLILASGCGYIELVEILLENGADIHAVNKYWRTAVMEAAFWGRLDMFNLLVKRGAKTDLKDSEGHTIADIVANTEENRLMRFKRAGGEVTPERKPARYIEDSFSRDEDRRVIVSLVKDTATLDIHGPPTADHCSSCKFQKDTDKMSVVLKEPTTTYSITNKYKTVGQLKRGDEYKTINAMSGWTHSADNTLISGRDLTARVFGLCKLIGYTLAAATDEDWDQGVPGQYNACHVEKQLILYYLDQHILPLRYTEVSPNEVVSREASRLVSKAIEVLTKDVKVTLPAAYDNAIKCFPTPVQGLFGPWYNDAALDSMSKVVEHPETFFEELDRTQEILNSSITKFKNVVQTGRKPTLRAAEMKRLAVIQPPTLLRSPAILVSSRVCDDCRAFVEKVNSHFGVDVRVYDCS